MNNENHETIADIVTEIRKRAEEVYVGQSGYPESWKNQMDYGEIYDGFSSRCSKCKAHLDGYYPSRKAAKKAWNESVVKFRKMLKGDTK